ncbi:hypothetical protein MASR1M65_18600 [Saprospiraceae bacterium]|jgi:hypothetical protein
MKKIIGRIAKHKFRHNPLYFSDEKTDSLDEAYNLFIETFMDYATQNNLTEEEIDNFKKQILSVYLEKKASYFFERKLVDFSDYLNKAISNALTKSFKDDDREDMTKLFYYNNKHRLISHEQ